MGNGTIARGEEINDLLGVNEKKNRPPSVKGTLNPFKIDKIRPFSIQNKYDHDKGKLNFFIIAGTVRCFN